MTTSEAPTASLVLEDGYEVEKVVLWSETHAVDETLGHAKAVVRRDTWEGWPVRAGLEVSVRQGYGEDLAETGVWRIDSITYVDDLATMLLTEVADA